MKPILIVLALRFTSCALVVTRAISQVTDVVGEILKIY